LAKELVESDKVKPIAAYSTGWKVSGGSLIMLAGQVAVDTEGNTEPFWPIT
jgi:enamine deaminase RidA (YjgF/YER057c/UK114 family)